MKYLAVCLALCLFLSQANEGTHRNQHTFPINPNTGTSTKAFQFDCKNCNTNKIDIKLPAGSPLDVTILPFRESNPCEGICNYELECDLDCYQALISKSGHKDHNLPIIEKTTIEIRDNGDLDTHSIDLELTRLIDDDEDDDDVDITTIPP